jgi:hypothetical protein
VMSRARLASSPSSSRAGVRREPGAPLSAFQVWRFPGAMGGRSLRGERSRL